MKKKIICIAICILIFMGACVCVYNNYSKKEVNSSNEELIDNKEEVIINKDEDKSNEDKVEKKEEQKKEEIAEINEEKESDLVDQPKNETSNNQTNTYKENKQVEEQTIQPEVIENSVDTNSLDYNEHKGRIDCYSSDECMNISLPMQFKYKKSITNSQYITVMSRSGNVLGYFIEYMFKENTYSSNEECENIGREIKQTLSDRVTSYQCNGSTLKINTDY